MSNTKRYIEDLEDKFYGQVEEWVKKAVEIRQVRAQAEIARQVDYPWMDESDVTDLVEELWLVFAKNK
jgi:hypothetical protein